MSVPYVLKLGVIGTAPILMHQWNTESVAEKSAAAKGSRAKKTDDVESYAYRTDEGYLGIPGNAMSAAIAFAGKSSQDPRSPRKSMYDMLRAGVLPLDIVTPFIPLTKDWDYEDKQRVVVQRAAITRTRPAMREGWRVEFRLLIAIPEYLTLSVMSGLITQAGRLCGLLDHRPTYGRFSITSMEVEAP